MSRANPDRVASIRKQHCGVSFSIKNLKRRDLISAARSDSVTEFATRDAWRTYILKQMTLGCKKHMNFQLAAPKENRSK